MIVVMPSTIRPQRRYDHRLRALVRRAGDVTVTTDLGVPRSTARGWLAEPATVVVSHHWLFLPPLDTVATVRRLVAFYVGQHNRVLPHSAVRGQTPDEMYFGTGSTAPLI
jgi:hypothetical protein